MKNLVKKSGEKKLKNLVKKSSSGGEKNRENFAGPLANGV